MQKASQQLEYISQAVGQYPSLVQGGGGNTSVKIDDNLMLIKASGYELRDVTAEEGFTIVQTHNIADYFNNIILADIHATSEKESVDFIKTQVQNLPGKTPLRPSMETGFHAILDKYVIHTHSVYSNFINCSTDGEALLKKVFSKTNIKPLWITFKSPGFFLTLEIREQMRKHQEEHNEKPQVIFLKNHGLIITDNDVDTCLALDNKVNQIIQQHFNVQPKDYPTINLTQQAEDIYLSQSDYLRKFFKENKVDETFFDRILFPDQTVYFKGNFSFVPAEKPTNKININHSTGEILYNTHHKEARTIEETLIAYLYILEQINRHQLTPEFINNEEVEYINNMESEKYRQNLLRK